MTNNCIRPVDGLTKTSLSKRSDAKRIARQMPGGRGRAYRCPTCGRYHVTTSPKRKAMDQNPGERHVYRLHYEGGAEVEVLAFNEQQAVVIAGRGTPVRIEQLNVAAPPAPAMPEIEDE